MKRRSIGRRLRDTAKTTGGKVRNLRLGLRARYEISRNEYNSSVPRACFDSAWSPIARRLGIKHKGKKFKRKRKN